jgi:hypothetical protein
LFFAAAGTPTVVAIGLRGYSYALNGKINRKAVGFDEMSAHSDAPALAGLPMRPMCPADERSIHRELMQASVIVDH